MDLERDKWSRIFLSECCEFQRGVVFSTKDEVDSGGIPILRSHNVDFETYRVSLHNLKYISDNVKVKPSQRLMKNDILISVANSKEQTGKVGFSYSDTNSYAGGFMGIIRPKDIVVPYFLFNYLTSPQGKEFIAGRTQGTTNIYNITFDRIKDLQIPLPPKEEQILIASLFQSIETAIEQVEIQAKSLITLKKHLLRDLFSNTRKFENYLTYDDFDNFKFGDLAINISERVEPKETDLEIYVGLEHLDSDCLKIERTGKPTDVIGTKLKIYKGDIIFGKRRAYLRKVAVSHFDGIASAHSMVLRANKKSIEKDFLPYFMQSDTFMERAVQISEGSLSPTIKWKTLAAQEFVLPKREKQLKLVEIFTQFDTTTNLLKKQTSTLRILKQNLLNEIFG